MTFFGEFYCERECLGLPWLGEYRAARITRKAGEAATRSASLPASGGIEVVIIEIEMDRVLRRGLIAP
jgi:hypothetical protein